MARVLVLALALAPAAAISHNERRAAAFDASRGAKKTASDRLVRSTMPSLRSEELEAAAKKEGPVTELVPKPAVTKKATKSKSRRLQDCSDTFYTVTVNTDTVAGSQVGSYANPAVIDTGCPYTLEIAPGKSFHLKLEDTAVPNAFGGLPQIFFSWAVDSENGETLLNLFSFRQQTAYGEPSSDAPTHYDWYYWPLLTTDAVTFREDTTGQMIDYYHCYGWCGYESSGLQNVCSFCGSTDLRTQYDNAWLTASSIFNSQTLTVVNIVDLLYSNKFIIEEELNVIKEMYATMCHPYTNAPEGWTWEDHQIVESDLEGEADTYNKPYCDWWNLEATLEYVNGLTTEDCLDLPGILCDEDGHVADIIIDTKGLRGPLPDSFNTLTHLQYLELPNNRIEGPLPQHVFDSPNMKKLDVYSNLFTGEIPCPANMDTQLIEITVAKNNLEGEIPNCIFEMFPALAIFDASRNLFQTEIPSSLSQATALSALFMQHAGVMGPISGFQNINNVASLDVSHNFITGEVTQAWINSMPKMYRIDLSWNQLTGPIPEMGAAATDLRRIHLDHNMLTGTIEDQFTTFAANQDRGALSELQLNANGFCGDLPYIFYTLLMDSHYFIYYFDVSQNHFRCSKEGDNKYWPDWAMSISHDFGMCIPIPVVTAIEQDTITVDRVNTDLVSTVTLHGQFVPTTEGTCKFMFAGMNTPTIVPATFVSTTEVTCVVPTSAPEGTATVTVAHYCDDYASADTLNGFTETVFVVVEGSLVSSGSSKKKTETNMGAVIGGSVAAGIALCFLAFIFFMCCRERQGKPIFKPLKDTENPLFPEGGAPKEDGIDLQVKENQNI